MLLEDPFWELRESIEVTAEMTFDQAKEFFKDGKWSLYDKVTRQVPDEPTEEHETPSTYHEETEYVESDMSDYCVCGFVRDNMDGTSTAKMGKLSELETFMASMLGGV